MATAREAAEELRKKKKEEKSDASSASARQAAEQIKKYNSLSTDGVDQKYIDSFIQDANTFLTTAEKDYGGLGWSNASSAYEGRNTTWQDLNTRADIIGAWLYKNRNSIDREAYDSLTKSLDTIRGDASSILGSFKGAADYYSQWQSEDEYNKWYQEESAYQKNFENVDADKASQGWQKYLADEETAKNALKHDLNNDGKEAWWEKTLGYLAGDGGGVVDTTLPTSGVTQTIHDLRADVSYMKPNDDWTEEQKNAFGQLYETSPHLAYNFADQTNKRNAKAKEEEALRQIVESATSNFWAGAGHTAGAIASAPFGLADYLSDLAMMNAGREVAPDGNVSPFEYSQAVTGGITEHLNEKSGTLDERIPLVGGKGLGDAYGWASSTAQSVASAYTLGPGGMLFSYFGQGAASGFDEKLEQGWSEEAAMVYGTTVGLIEGIWESIGGERLLNLGSAATAKSFIRQLADQAMAEGLEGGLASVSSKVAEDVIDRIYQSGSTSYDLLVQAYMANGMSEAEAQSKAWWDMVEEVAFDTISEGLSGGVGGGVQTIGQNIASNIDAKKTYGNGADLVKGSLNIDPNNAYAQKMQAKVDGGKSLSGGQINRLIENNEQSRNAQNIADIASALQEKGMSPEEAAKTAEWLYKAADGETYTRKQQKAYANDDRISDVHRDLFTNEENSVNKRNAEYDALYALAQEKSGVTSENTTSQAEASAQQAKAAPVTENAPAEQNAAETKFEASERGKAKIGDTEVAIKEIASVKDGEMVLRLEDGSTVNASDVEYGSSAEAILYENVVDLGLNAVTANAFIKNYDGSIPADQYALGFREAYRYGEYGFPVQEMTTKGFSAQLSEAQRSLAYDLGKTDMKYKVSAQQKAKIDSTVAEKTAKNATSGGKKGKVYRDFASAKTLNARQKQSLKALEVVAESLGVDIHVFESAVGKDGKRVGANGWYDPSDNSIHIDLYAGASGEATMLFTAAHELTHFIREWSPAKFKTFADFLLEQYGEKGVSVEQLVQRQIEKAKRSDRDIDFDTAYEEVIADSCEAMLTDSNAMEKIALLKAQDKSLWSKIKKFISDLVAKIKEVYQGLNPDSLEANYVREMKDAAEKLYEMWTDALVDAGSSFQAAASQVLKADAKAISADEIVTDGAVVTDGNGGKYSIRSMKADIAEGQMFEDLKTYCGWSQAQVDKLKTQLEDLVAYMTPYRDILDMNETYGREGRRYSPYKPNSDPLYTISMDFSTLCSKRLLTQYVIENLQLRENRPMSAEEQMAIRDMLKEYRKVEKGLQVACVMCYVEAARLKAPKQINKWLGDPATAMRNYFADKNPEFSAYIKKAQEDFKESRGYARDAVKKDMSAKDVTALNKIRPKVRAEYNPSAEEIAIIETAKSLPNSTYLTAANLANLSEEHPEIYKAYTAFIRTATRSKSLETDEPYYYGDSRRDNGNGIIVSDSFIESVNRENGMRFSSWSDWRIQHLLDFISAVIDNSVRGAAMHGYTKFGDEVRVLGKTGMMFNLSGVAGTQTGLNEDGSLNFSDTESIDIDEAIALREEFPETAGLQCIGVSKEHILALLRSDIIDYVIPYHTSGLNATLRRMGDIYGWDDFTQTQHATPDSSIKKENAQDPENWHKEPIFSEFFVGYDTGLSGIEAMRQSADNYIRMCRERGLTPKFKEFSNEPNYWKLLIDRKMVNQKTNTLIQQKPVTPDFDFDVIKGIVDKYVQNYDSGLESRAFNYIVENWDSVPGRIRDLKKQGTTKAKTTKKAIDKLANETLAAQPKPGVKQSARDVHAAESDYQNHPFIVAVGNTVADYESRGSWTGKFIGELYKSQPQYDYLRRLHNGDMKAAEELKNLVASITDVDLLENLIWYPVYTYNPDSRKVLRKAINAYKKVINARKQEVMEAQVSGTDVGMEARPYTLAEIRTMFDSLNSNADVAKLADKVFETAESLGLEIHGLRSIEQSSNVSGAQLFEQIAFRTHYFNDKAVSDQSKASTILHELIHGCTTYAIRAYEKNLEDAASGYRRHGYGYNMSDNMNYAVEKLRSIYSEVKKDQLFKGEYGTKTVYEMVAELSNPQFREKLQKRNLWDQIIDAIKRMFGIETKTYLDGVSAALDYILDNVDRKQWERYVGRDSRANRAQDKMMFAEGVKYSDRVLMGSLFSGGGTLEAGLVYQMLDKEFAVEYNEKIASAYTDNHGKEHMFVGDVRDFDSKAKQNVFYLHASPVCKNFSPASHKGGETTLDITTAQATVRVLEEQMPEAFTVENVKRYIGSEAFNLITSKLDELGYTWDVDVYKASDYGNATKRERMIIRAVKNGELPSKPTKASSITSWGEATKDLWKTDLIPSNLVKSKIEAIKNTPALKGIKLTKLDKPLMIYDTTKSKTITYAWADELAPTLTTKCGDARIIMPDGRVYAPTPKFMGRIQGLPDDYKYPSAKTRAFTIIGNGIPTQLTKAVMGGVLDSAYEQTHDGQVLYSDRDNGWTGKDKFFISFLESLNETENTSQGISATETASSEKDTTPQTWAEDVKSRYESLLSGLGDNEKARFPSVNEVLMEYSKNRVGDSAITKAMMAANKLPNRKYLLEGLHQIDELLRANYSEARELSDAEVNAILAEKGLPPKQRVGGDKTLADLGLSEYDGKMYSDRDTDSVSNRSLLANALESVAQNDAERNKLKEYKRKIALIESEQAKLAETKAKIKELSFAKGRRDTEAIKKLQFEANQSANRINTYDRQLLNLEATAALKGVLQREKQLAYKKAEKEGKEALAAYREKAAKTQRELMTRYQESRKKGVEGRRKTEMRHKIKDVVNELNQYLLKGTKEKHVPIGLQASVAEALDAVNMDTVGAEERIAKKREEMRIEAAKGNMERVEKLAKEIKHIQEMGDNMEAKLQRFKAAYDEILNSDDPLIANSHDEVISNSIANVIKEVGDTPIRDMSLSQLESVYDLYRMVLTTIRNTNKAFKAAKGEAISTIANGVIDELDAKKKSPKVVKGLDKLSEFDWNNLKPVYAFERIGSANFRKVFNAVRDGEDAWATDMSEAKAFREAQEKKHNYKSFDFDKQYDFVSSTGLKFTLRLDQIMSLYAYSKRGQQAKDHLKYGGFQFDGVTEIKEKKGKVINVTYQLKDTTAYKISDELLSEIIGVLDQVDGAKAFVDEMQEYLSSTMGEKGNEVSLALYDVKLFKEKNYFPLRVSHDFLARAREQAQGDVKIKNSGFTKETTPNAKNPIVLSSFMDVWASHVNEMSMYHAFTLPLEDFYRVYNYATPSDEKLDTISVVSSLRGAHRDGPVQYIDQLLKDLNGGARSDPRETLGKAMMSNFKKAAVMGSLSVVVQQPTAIVRATALVDAKYFAGKKVAKGKHKEMWAEVKKYAPVAVIKEMGYFDTGMGKGSVEWLKGEETWKDKVDDAISKAPALADEITWVAIWNAVKRETLHTHKHLQPNSDAFLQAVGERFTEVITKTQVYDSTLSRSANMRSKSAFMNMVTAFMAEPTTSINMLQDAILKGDKKYIARSFAAVYGSVVLNSALVSLIYAMRDDDEDETFLEKYLSRFTTEVVDGINPLTYIPIVKDIWSIAQGFDVERADMSLMTDLFDSLQQMFKVASKDTSNMDEDELADHKKSVTEALASIVDNISSLAGVPVKNVRRDIKGVINFFQTVTNGKETTAGSLADVIGGDLKDSVPVWGWFPDESKGDKLYDAIIRGDEDYVDRLKSGYKSDTAYQSAVRKALRENDPRIKEAATAVVNGDFETYTDIIDAIVGEGHFTEKDIKSAIDSEVNEMTPDEETSEDSAESKEESIYEVEYIFREIMDGDTIMAQAMREDIIRTKMANGSDRDEAEESFNTSFTSYLKKQYDKGEVTDYEAKSMLISFGGKTEEEAASKVQYWNFKQQYPDYDLSESAVTKYYSDVASSGISVGVYYDYCKQSAKCKGTDADGDGRADSGTKKAEIMSVIDSLPLTYAQKDALYYLNGWSASTIWQAPWH